MVDRRRLLVTACCLVVWRLLEQIPVADLSPAFVQTRLQLYSGPGFFAAIGANSIPFSSYSVGYEGIGPYVNALVIVSLVGVVSSAVKSRFSTPEGRRTLTQWARALALLLAMGQAYGWTVLAQTIGAIPDVDWSARLFVCVQLTAGTAVAILLAGAIDEFGLGFGYSAFVLYALQIVGAAGHRLADGLANNPSLDAAIRSLLLGSAWTVIACAACVAVLLAARRVAAPTGKRTKEVPPLVAIPMVASGVFRPSQFVFAVMFLPTLVANYYVAANSPAVNFFVANWSPSGPSAWLSAVYVGLESVLIILFAVFVAGMDQLLLQREPAVALILQRLAVVGGVCLAVLVVLIPVAARLVEARVGMLVPLGGFSLVIVVTMVLIVIREVERKPQPMGSLFP